MRELSLRREQIANLFPGFLSSERTGIALFLPKKMNSREGVHQEKHSLSFLSRKPPQVEFEPHSFKTRSESCAKFARGPSPVDKSKNPCSFWVPISLALWSLCSVNSNKFQRLRTSQASSCTAEQ